MIASGFFGIVLFVRETILSSLKSVILYHHTYMFCLSQARNCWTWKLSTPTHLHTHIYIHTTFSCHPTILSTCKLGLFCSSILAKGQGGGGSGAAQNRVFNSEEGKEWGGKISFRLTKMSPSLCKGTNNMGQMIEGVGRSELRHAWTHPKRQATSLSPVGTGKKQTTEVSRTGRKEGKGLVRGSGLLLGV